MPKVTQKSGVHRHRYPLNFKSCSGPMENKYNFCTVFIKKIIIHTLYHIEIIETSLLPLVK